MPRLPVWASRLLPRRRGAPQIEYALLAALVAAAALGAVALTGDRVRGMLAGTGGAVADGTAALPPGAGGADGGAPSEPGQGIWSGDGAFALAAPAGTQTRIFLLTNVGAGVLALGGPPAVEGPGATAFETLATDCGAALLPGESCGVEIRAAAGSNGTAEALLAAAGIPGGIALSLLASGFDPLLAWTPGAPVSIDGSAATPATGQTTFTLRNDGFAPASLEAPAVSGAGWSIAGTTCGAALEPGDSCDVALEAWAADNGPLPDATLSAGGATITASGAASGFAAVLAWSGQTDLAIGAPPATPATVQQTLTLTNSGTLPATGVAPAVAGDPAFALVATTCGPTLAPGASCAATVSFTADADVSSASAQISAGGVPGAIAALSGSASGIAPALAWSGVAPALDGTPPQTLPVAGQTTYTLVNTGNQDAAGLGAVSMAGAGWSLVSTTCGPVLAQGASCDATLRLEAAAAGTFPGALSIAGGPSLAIAGSAAGFVPALAWSGEASFAVTAGGGPGTTERTLTLGNAGTAPATGLAITVTGTGYGLVSTTCGATLGPGVSCAATVRMTATQNGTYAGALQASADGAPAAQRALAGTISGFSPPVWITGTGLPGGTVGAGYGVNLVASDPDGDLGTAPAGSRFQIVGGALPPGLSLSTSGSNAFTTLSGTLSPTAGGTHAFTIRATDARGLAADRTFSVSVPAWQIAAASNYFEFVPGQGMFHFFTFTVRNTSPAPAFFPGLAYAVPAQGAFMGIYGSSGCGWVGPGGACTLAVQTAPETSPLTQCTGQFYNWQIAVALNAPGVPAVGSTVLTLQDDPTPCTGVVGNP